MLGTSYENGGGTRDGERTYAATEEPDWHDIAGVIDALRGSESTGGLMWHDPSGTALPPRGTPVLVVWPGLVTSRAFEACGWLIGPAAEHAMSRRPPDRSHVPRPSAESMHGIAGRDELGVRAIGVLDLIVDGAARGLAGSTIAVPSGGDMHRCPTPVERAALDAAVTFAALDTNEIDAAVVHPRVRVLGEMTRMWVVPLVNRSVTIVRGSLHGDYRWATPTVPYSDAEERTARRIETTAEGTRSVDLNQRLLSAVYRQVAEGETGGRVAAAVGHLRRAWSNSDGVDHSERIVALCAGFEALLGEPPGKPSRKRWMAEHLDALFAAAREAGGRPPGFSRLIWDHPARGGSHLEDFCGVLLQARNNAMHELSMLCKGHSKRRRRVVDRYADLVGPDRPSESFETAAKRRREQLLQQMSHLFGALSGGVAPDPADATDAHYEDTDARGTLKRAISEMTAWRASLLSESAAISDERANTERRQIEEQIADAIRVIDDTLGFFDGVVRVIDEDGPEAAMRAMTRFLDKTSDINVFCQPALLMPSAETVPRLLFRDGERLLRDTIRAKCALSADDPAAVLEPPSYEDVGLAATFQSGRSVSGTITSGIRVTHDPRHPSEQPGQIIDTAL